MPWLKQDDGMGEHPKTKRLIRRRRLLGLAAFGLHDLACLHASRYLTDGHVPSELVEDICYSAGLKPKDQADLTAALVASGQWTEHPEDGWMIHDYLDHNPSAAQVEASRGVDRFRKELTRDTELLAAIRQRDGNQCRYCGVGVNWKDRRSNVGGTYDHVVPVSKGGTNTFGNVVVACRGCNGRKGPRTPEDAGMPLRNDESRLETSTPTGRSDLAATSGPPSRPIPSRPPNNPPNPPHGGNRQRDRDRHENDLQAWALQAVPEADRSVIVAATKHALSRLRPDQRDRRSVRWIAATDPADPFHLGDDVRAEIRREFVTAVEEVAG